MHAFLDPLILTPRGSSDKYHLELAQILADGGGAGEIEECMMWYAWNYEKTGDEDKSKGVAAEHPDEKWRTEWLERMERRE